MYIDTDHERINGSRGIPRAQMEAPLNLPMAVPINEKPLERAVRLTRSIGSGISRIYDSIFPRTITISSKRTLLFLSMLAGSSIFAIQAIRNFDDLSENISDRFSY